MTDATEPTDGPCVWCGEYVTDQRAESGANFHDWGVDGDFGCDRNPITGDDGCGGHMRPGDRDWQRCSWALLYLSSPPPMEQP